LATVAIDTFITELSSVIKNWPEANVNNTSPEAPATRSLVSVTPRTYQPYRSSGIVQTLPLRASLLGR
jgi:hypothetical protein